MTDTQPESSKPKSSSPGRWVVEVVCDDAEKLETFSKQILQAPGVVGGQGDAEEIDSGSQGPFVTTIIVEAADPAAAKKVVIDSGCLDEGCGCHIGGEPIPAA